MDPATVVVEDDISESALVAAIGRADSHSEEEPLQLSSEVVTSSDTESSPGNTLRPYGGRALTHSSMSATDQATEHIIAETFSSRISMEVASRLFEEHRLCFYAALLEFRSGCDTSGAALDDVRKRALAMSILERFVVDKSNPVKLSPECRKALADVHRKLQAFYTGRAYKRRPPRLAADLFETAAQEVRVHIRDRVREGFHAAMADDAFRQRALKPVTDTSQQFVTQEELLLHSLSTLRKAEQVDEGTIRCAAPASVKPVIDKALADWLDAGDGTLRHMLQRDTTGSASRARTVQELRTIAHIEFQVEQWCAKDTAHTIRAKSASTASSPAAAVQAAKKEASDKEQKIAAAMAQWLGQEEPLKPGK